VDRSVNDSFKFNKETEFVPIAGLVEVELNKKDDSPQKNSSATSIQNNHHPAILAVLAEELSVAAEEIHDFELWVRFITTAYPSFISLAVSCMMSSLLLLQA
jgi:aspartyl aminopeptidase